MNKELNLHAVTLKKKPKYVHGEKNKVFPNIVKQNFNVVEINTVWCTDFTYIRMENGKMRYNCTVLDLARMTFYGFCVLGNITIKNRSGKKK